MVDLSPAYIRLLIFVLDKRTTGPTKANAEVRIAFEDAKGVYWFFEAPKNELGWPGLTRDINKAAIFLFGDANTFNKMANIFGCVLETSRNSYSG